MWTSNAKTVLLENRVFQLFIRDKRKVPLHTEIKNLPGFNDDINRFYESFPGKSAHCFFHNSIFEEIVLFKVPAKERKLSNVLIIGYNFNDPLEMICAYKASGLICTNTLTENNVYEVRDLGISLNDLIDSCEIAK